MTFWEFIGLVAVAVVLMLWIFGEPIGEDRPEYDDATDF